MSRTVSPKVSLESGALSWFDRCALHVRCMSFRRIHNAARVSSQYLLSAQPLIIMVLRPGIGDLFGTTTTASRSAGFGVGPESITERALFAPNSVRRHRPA